MTKFIAVLTALVFVVAVDGLLLMRLLDFMSRPSDMLLLVGLLGLGLLGLLNAIVLRRLLVWAGKGFHIM